MADVGNASPSGGARVVRTVAGTARPPGAPEKDLVATNSWARRTILARARLVDLPPDLAKQIGNIAVWYYNRILLRLKPDRAASQELPPSMNRYLVPISLGLACDYKNHHIDLDRLLRISANPTTETVANAHRMYAQYSRLLAPPRKPVVPGKVVRSPPRPKDAAISSPSFRVRSPNDVRPPPVARRVTHPANPAPRPTPLPSTTSLALPPSGEVLELRKLTEKRPALHRPAPLVAHRPRQANTNVWARRQISDRCRTLRLPEEVRRHALKTYEAILALHSARGHAPPGRRLILSPRLNSSLVHTTIYLGCRLEEHPADLREIMGGNPRRGALREIYRLYRIYKRELKLEIRQVDVKTFIQSWIDGYDLGEVMNEKAAAEDNARLQHRAVAIANRAKGDAAFRGTSTKLLAAGALTTALAERERPGNLSAFLRAIAAILHMGEQAIRTIVARLERVA